MLIVFTLPPFSQFTHLILVRFDLKHPFNVSLFDRRSFACVIVLDLFFSVSDSTELMIDRNLEYLIAGVALRCLHRHTSGSSSIGLSEHSHNFTSASRGSRRTWGEWLVHRSRR